MRTHAIVRRGWAGALGVVLLSSLVALQGCGLNDVSIPELDGPATFAANLTLRITPDLLVADGVSQAVVTALFFDSNGRPAANREIFFTIADEDGQFASIGFFPTAQGPGFAVTARTDAQGIARVVYQVPPRTDATADQTVLIAARPIGDDATDATCAGRAGATTARATTARAATARGAAARGAIGAAPARATTVRAATTGAAIARAAAAGADTARTALPRARRARLAALACPGRAGAGRARAASVVRTDPEARSQPAACCRRAHRRVQRRARGACGQRACCLAVTRHAGCAAGRPRRRPAARPRRGHTTGACRQRTGAAEPAARAPARR